MVGLLLPELVSILLLIYFACFHGLPHFKNLTNYK